MDLQVIGVDRVMCEIMRRIDPDNDRKIYVSFDIDGLDPCYAPSTGVPGIILKIYMIIRGVLKYHR